MKTNQLVRLTLVATLCLFQVAAWAQPGRGNDNGRDNGRGNGRNNGMGYGRNNDCGRDRQNCDQGPGNNRDRGNYRPDMRRHNEGEQGAGPDHSFYRGERLPSYYRSRQYVVDDWRGHGLRSPPRGYHWVQTGGDYVLVAIATGLILELLLSH
jgi:Ni/Co efflux regulator RcnB